jgi:hypothetical protein
MIFGTYREEPIIYIDGPEKEKISTTTNNNAAKLNEPGGKLSKNEEEEEEEESSIVHDTAEAASKDDALPDIPWYIRPFASSLSEGTKKPKVQ